MTVKSDRWIRRITEESDFIRPFDAALVREVDGRRIISANASSNGYDVRLADDGSRYYLIPPQSYALGATVETFKMHHNVMVIAMSESTSSRSSKPVSPTVWASDFTGTFSNMDAQIGAYSKLS